MQNHAKNGEKNVYAIELLLYVLYAYIACGAIMIIGCILVWLGYLELPTGKFFFLLLSFTCFLSYLTVANRRNPYLILRQKQRLEGPTDSGRRRSGAEKEEAEEDEGN